MEPEDSAVKGLVDAMGDSMAEEPAQVAPVNPWGDMVEDIADIDALDEPMQVANPVPDSEDPTDTNQADAFDDRDLRPVQETNEPSATLAEDMAAIGHQPTSKFLAMQDDVSSDAQSHQVPSDGDEGAKLIPQQDLELSPDAEDASALNHMAEEMSQLLKDKEEGVVAGPEAVDQAEDDYDDEYEAAATPRANTPDRPDQIEDEEMASHGAATEDELGVNDEFFNFKEFKYQGKLDFEEIEQPEDMQEMFESVYGKQTGANRVLDSPLNMKRKFRDETSMGSMPANYNKIPSELNAAHDTHSSNNFSLKFENDDPFDKDVIQLAEINLKDVQEVESREIVEEERLLNARNQVMINRFNEVNEIRDNTYGDLESNRKRIVTKMREKEERMEDDYNLKRNVLKSNFNENLTKLLKNVATQREIVSHSYGPLTLNDKKNERPIFEIKQDVDPEGYKHAATLEKSQLDMPQILNIQLKQCRCLKDKISPGYFVIKVKALNRLGGNELVEYNYHLKEQFKDLAESLREFSKKKREYLDKEHRETVEKQADGTTITKAAQATGLAFFQAKQAKDQGQEIDIEAIQQKNKELAEVIKNAAGDESDRLEEAQFDPTVHQIIDMEKKTSNYRRFNARYDDYDLEINDVVNVLIPPLPESSTVLQFELILLESASIPKDYCVAWGVFPVCNSEFQINEGKFKCPLLFGAVNKKFDKFSRLEERWIEDLDHWLCNLYFEVEKINLMDLRWNAELEQLFFSPIYQLNHAKKLANDQDAKKEVEVDENGEIADPYHDLKSQTEESGSAMDFRQSMADDEDFMGQSISQKPEEQESEASDQEMQFAQVVDASIEPTDLRKKKTPPNQAREVKTYTNEVGFSLARTDEEMDYDSYKFQVGVKYDLQTSNRIYKKWKYITDEILTDLRAHWTEIDFQLALVSILTLFFMRIYIHYFGQYIMSRILGVPVTRFEPTLYKVHIETAAFNLEQEIAIIVSGVGANTAAMLALMFFAWIMKTKLCFCRTFPRRYYQIICYYGLYVLFDPFLVLLVDAIDYRTFNNSDWGKLPKWYYDKEKTAITGIYLVLFLNAIVVIINGSIFYFYMVTLHQNGRIMDLYRRLQGDSTSFFVPNDQEVSKKYLQWLMSRITSSEHQDYIVKSEEKTVYDKVGRKQLVQFLQIFKFHKNQIRKSRLFYKDFDGAINEIPQNKMTLTYQEADELFAEHDHHGEERILIPKSDNIERFKKLKDGSYREISNTQTQETLPNEAPPLKLADELPIRPGSAHSNKNDVKRFNSLLPQQEPDEGRDKTVAAGDQTKKRRATMKQGPTKSLEEEPNVPKPDKSNDSAENLSTPRLDKAE